jgi:hypothetical protein
MSGLAAALVAGFGTTEAAGGVAPGAYFGSTTNCPGVNALACGVVFGL